MSKGVQLEEPKTLTLVLDILGSRLRVERTGRDGLRLDTNKPGPRGIPVMALEQGQVRVTMLYIISEG